MALSILDRAGDINPHLPSASGGGGGVTGSSDSSLTIAGTDAIVNVAKAFAWTAAQTWTTTTVPITSTITDASAATVLEAARFRHLSSVAGTVGTGVYVSLWSTNGTPAAVESARIQSILRTVTPGSEASVTIFQLVQTGSLVTAAWVTGTSLYAASILGIGSVNASGVTTDTFTVQINSSMVQYSSRAAVQGGHTFIGTANSSGARQFFVITPSANTASTLGTEIKKFQYAAYTNQWATGALTTQREFCIEAPTYGFVAASTITDTATFYISGAPIAGTNATITRSYSIWTDDGDVRHDNIGVALGAGGLATLGLTGGSGPATSTQNKWARINIDGTNYFIPVWV